MKIGAVEVRVIVVRTMLSGQDVAVRVGRMKVR